MVWRQYRICVTEIVPGKRCHSRQQSPIILLCYIHKAIPILSPVIFTPLLLYSKNFEFTCFCIFLALSFMFSLHFLANKRQRRFWVGAWGTCPQIHLLPQIQKLVDRSDVISEVPKCSKIIIFRGFAQTPIRSLQRSPRPSRWWGGAHFPLQEPHPRYRPFGPRFYGFQGLTHYTVGNPTNDRFQM